MNQQDRPLPTLHDEMLDSSGVGALFADIRANASAVSVQVKGGALKHAEQGAISLSEAEVELRAGRVMGVQIRYLRGAEEWCDTLMAMGESTRLIRMKQSE